MHHDPGFLTSLISTLPADEPGADLRGDDRAEGPDQAAGERERPAEDFRGQQQRRGQVRGTTYLPGWAGLGWAVQCTTKAVYR